MLEEFSVKAVKRILFIFNLFFALTGLVLLIIGVTIKTYLTRYEPFLDDRYFSASSLLIASGSIIFIISFFGCCGAIKENRCMVLTFSLLLTFVMLLEFASGVTGYILTGQTSGLVQEKLNETMKLYANNVTDIQILWDTVQEEFECCGINSSKDWLNVLNNSLPMSCCKTRHGARNFSTCYPDSEDLFKFSCSDQLSHMVKDNTITLGGVAFGVVAVQFLGILFACYLGRYIKQSNYETV